jgi:hypothetical protein
VIKYLLLPILIWTFGIAKAQQADERAVINLMVRQNHDPAVYYSSGASMAPWCVRYCDSVLTNDHQKIISLSPDDKKEFTAKLKTAEAVYAWPNGYFANMVPADSMKRIFRDTSLGWRYFKQKYSGRICTITKPVFIHNNTICLVTYTESANYTDYNNKQQVEWEKRYGEAGSFGFDIRIYVKNSSGEWELKGLLLKEIS